MKYLWKTSLSILLMSSAFAAAQQDVVVIPPTGGSFVIKDDAGQETVLEVTSTGQIVVNGKAVDLEPPVVTIDAPDITTTGFETVTVTISDNKGLFKVLSETRYQDEGYVLFAGETEATIQYQTEVPFAADMAIEAYAIDLAGNATTARKPIGSNSVIAVGKYTLDSPINEIISGNGCQLQYFDPEPYNATKISVTGRFRIYNECDYSDTAENPNAVACVTVSIENESPDYLPIGGLYIESAIDTLEQSWFSKEQLRGSGFNSAESYESFAVMDVEFFDSNPPTVNVTGTLKCVSSEFGIETWGPWTRTGTWVSPDPD